MKKGILILIIIIAAGLALYYANAQRQEVTAAKPLAQMKEVLKAKRAEVDPDEFSKEFLSTFMKEFDAAWAKISEEKKEDISGMSEKESMSYITDLVRKEVAGKLKITTDQFNMALNQANQTK